LVDGDESPPPPPPQAVSKHIEDSKKIFFILALDACLSKLANMAIFPNNIKYKLIIRAR